MSGKKFDVITVGDCVVDCISYVDRMPKMGETMAALNFIATPGGKGANACTAGARLGSTNAFVCKLGNDMFGRNFLETLRQDNVNTEHVTFTDRAPTSVASIMVDREGHNAIVVNFGATLELDEADLDRADESISASKVLVVSRVVKEATALYALKLAKKHDLITVFNFAPAIKDLNVEFNKYVDILVVNEVEAEVFTDSIVNTVDDAIRAANIVLSREGFHIGVVVTLGDQGALFVDKETRRARHFKSPKVKEVIDTTGAGDAFVGSLAHYIGSWGIKSIDKSIELACEYASVSVQFKGTQASYPVLSSLDPKFKV